MKKNIIFWSSFPQISNFYKPRWGHTLNIYKNKAYIFGGYTNKYKKDIYSIDLSSTKLPTEKINPQIKSKEKINKRLSQHSSIIYDNKLIIYGGKTSNSLEISINPISFDLISQKWEIIKTINPPKQIRAAHTSNLINNKYMFVFGGEESYNKNNNLIFDALLLNFETLKWSKLNYPNSNKLNKRKYHCSCNVNQYKVYIYGGYCDNYNCLNSMLIFDFCNINNINVKEINFDNFIYNVFPFPRWGCSINFYNGKLFIFGGRNKIDFNDLWMFDIQSEKWEKLDSLTETPISRRRQVSFIYKNILFISGGFNGYEFLNDLYFSNLNLLYPFISYSNNPIFSDINRNLNMNLLLNNLSKCYPEFKLLFDNHIIEKQYYENLNSIPFFRFKNNSDLIPSKIFNIFSNFIQNKLISYDNQFEIENLCIFIESLFYADFYCFISLYNELENNIIKIIKMNKYSKYFLCFILICSFLTNSKILFQFIFQFIRNKYVSSMNNICCFINKILKDDQDKHDLLNELIHNWNKNSYYYKINKNIVKNNLNIFSTVLSNFILSNEKLKFIEEKNVKDIINRLNDAKIKFNVPKIIFGNKKSK